MDIDKEIELLELKIKELELRKEIKKYENGNENIIKIPEIIKIPIIIPECPLNPCPKREPVCPYPCPPFKEPYYVGDPLPGQEPIVICKTKTCDTSKVNFKEM